MGCAVFRGEEMICDHCQKEFNELVTREGFSTTYYVEWVCKGCFNELEGKRFEDYSAVDYYGEENV